MAMFKQSDNSEGLSPDTAETFIGPSVKLEGSFDADGDIVVEGILTGNITTRGDVRVGSQAVIDAQIAAKNAHIAGKVKGNLTVEGSLKLASTATIHGDIKTSSISIEEGATINGKINMGGAKGRSKANQPHVVEKSEKPDVADKKDDLN